MLLPLILLCNLNFTFTNLLFKIIFKNVNKKIQMLKLQNSIYTPNIHKYILLLCNLNVM